MTAAELDGLVRQAGALQQRNAEAAAPAGGGCEDALRDALARVDGARCASGRE
jgi:hypothetical protein